MELKRKIKHFLILAGWQPKRRLNWPVGVDWHFDLDFHTRRDSVEMIFDVGANIGQTAIECHEAFPKAKIFSFEPVKSTFDEAVKNVARLNRVEMLHQAMGEKPGEMEISIKPDSVGASLKNHGNEIGREIIKVATVDDFCASRKIDRIHLLKIDTEGFETEVLKGAERMLGEGRIDYIFAEAGMQQDDQTHTYLGFLMDYLKQRGFRTIGFYDQSEPWIPNSFVNVLFKRV